MTLTKISDSGKDAADILARFRTVREDIDRAARHVPRDPAGVTLLCASKTQGVERIEPLLAAGHRLFGENRVQEAKTKWPELRARYPDVDLHLIGPLQTNKVRDALKLFDVIETLDREHLAEAIATESAKLGKRPKLFVEVNTGAEPQKAGLLPAEADAFIARCRQVHGLDVVGLMCIPPADDQASPHFALLSEIAKRNGLSQLSMGMSADFGQAVQLGSTEVRVGTAIFGARQA
ncbi:YggS family pyridoxal phosphate-dependent enzyme [Methylocella sp. CPCC 101449]|uniref:YggS family pyridoxal phosphate-dependent enzyme n=1 Tax=Methylocella sp. CPCC 101449 TaxID=2987531 RepID=UPI00288DD839|nr:YggS family pyridoxal phosphate-dependent enzyme [Methylocella sp. CPCC 101449]MDT2020452.1 YggS family pyridoxal phosphate-dependent enzyme [Methylocella sp. CPCC 101449]